LERLDDKLFCALVEQSTDVIVVLDENANVRFISPSAHRSLGYPDAQLVGKSGFAVLHPDDRARTAEALKFALDNPDIPVSAELRLQRRDGATRTFEAVAKNFTGDPVVRGVVITLRDVTERIEYAARLRAVSRAREATSSLLKLALEDLTLEELLRSALGIIVGADCDFLDRRGAIFLIDGVTRHLVLAAQVGMGDGFSAACADLPLDRCECGTAARVGEMIVVDSVALSRGDCPGLCPASRYLVPIMAGRSPMGVLMVGVREPEARSMLEREFFNSVADAMAGMIRRHRAEEENKRLSAIIRENPNPVLECDVTGAITYENPAAKQLGWQYSVDIPDLLPKNHGEIVANALAGGETGSRRAESSVAGRVFGWTYHPVTALQRIHVFGRDITERRRAEEQLAHGVMHDQLTGLANRTLLADRINAAIGMAKRRDDYGFAILLLDVDRFKVITESLGHGVGDKVLNEIAGRLSACAGPGDTVGRLGGDEFVVMLGDAGGARDAIGIAKRITERLGEPISAGEHNLELTASVGIVLSSTEYNRAEDILRDADTAMYRAKSRGVGGYAVFDEDMHKDAVERLRAQTDLRSAIDKGELTVFYQPILALKDLRIRGFEALVRWRHPVHGEVLPGKFISVAEETGLIVPLGDQVLRSVCLQLARWRDSKLPLAWVSVNLAAQQFQREGVVQEILALLGDTGIDGRRLMLEITESTAAEDPERAVRTMAELRHHGVRIALDDFGTGYSSMSYLKKFPIDSLKIDRSFVRDLPESHDDAAIASSVVAMSHALGLKVVAEGVENERQAMYLRSIDCDEVQGFLYGRPTTAERATALLQQGVPRTEKVSGD
jgi:diguanylate cyclase (GGDEF)-like protein/PAS domain S-box-containing protein